jgi:hypothetical protein
MTVYRSSTHLSLTERLVDAAMGGALGGTAGMLLWLVDIWLRLR